MKYTVYLYPTYGGYNLYPYTVDAEHETEALEKAVVDAMTKGDKGMYCLYDECDFDDNESYTYLDLSEYGKPNVYVRTDEAKIFPTDRDPLKNKVNEGILDFFGKRKDKNNKTAKKVWYLIDRQSGRKSYGPFSSQEEANNAWKDITKYSSSYQFRLSPQVFEESLTSDMKNGYYVIYKENGKFKGTPKSNYDARFRDANMISDYSAFDKAEDIVDYLAKYTPQKNKDHYIIKEDLEDNENKYLKKKSNEPTDMKSRLDAFTKNEALNDTEEGEIVIKDKEIEFEPSTDEPKLETFEDKMDFLAKDEQEAIDGYDKVLAMLGEEDANVKEQLEKIRTEEIAHKEFLEKIKTDKSAVYTEPLEQEETVEVEDEVKVEEPLTESVNLSIDEDDLKELLYDRVNFWIPQALDEDDAELFYNMYENYVDGGVFEGYKDFNVSVIVDNDVINYCQIVRKGDDMWEEAVEAYNNGEYEFGRYYIEEVNSDGTKFLVRYTG